MANNKILQKLQNGQPVRGVWLGIPSVHSVRLLARLPLDWMVIDMEHAPTSLDNMVSMVAAVTEADGPQPVVRLSQVSAENIKWALDAGAAGIIAPMVNTGEEAARVASLCRLPPLGLRSFGSSYAGMTWGQTMSENQKASNGQIMVAVQVENKLALDNLDAIFSTPGLDMVLVGPLDLSLSLGVDYFYGGLSPVLDKALESVLAASRKHHIPLGIYCGSAEIARKRIEQGFLFVNVAHDTNILVEGVREALKVSGQ
jgi:4-hydroxy-2-oxoheptanedioate aldolase